MAGASPDGLARANSPPQLMSSYHLLEKTHNRFSAMHFTLAAEAAKKLPCSHFLVMQVHDAACISFLGNSNKVPSLLPLCI